MSARPVNGNTTVEPEVEFYAFDGEPQGRAALDISNETIAKRSTQRRLCHSHGARRKALGQPWNEGINRITTEQSAIDAGFWEIIADLAGGRTINLVRSAGSDGIGRTNDGKAQSREEMMAGIHAWTEDWAVKNRGKSLDELVAISQATRSETLELLSSLTDEQLQSKIPGAPWADGTVGGIMAANAGHGRTHYGYAKDGSAAQ